ncbi:MAG: hypothetical protein AAF547_21460 [Actinomycetota bacterium]
MNFVGHIKVALDQLDDGDRAARDGAADPTGLLIGSALPDIAAIGRFRLTEPAAEASVRAGVALHHRTDDAFHSHRWFRHHSGAVATALSEAGLGRGATRAVGHVGVELLLDGYLLATDPELEPRAAAALGSVAEPGRGLVGVVDDDRRAEWADHLDRTARWGLPPDYRDPLAVAARLRRILSARPRLRFASAEVETVATVLADAQPGLEAGADDLVADLAELV